MVRRRFECWIKRISNDSSSLWSRFFAELRNYALRKTADDNEEKFGDVVTSTLRRNFYVDDYLRSVSTEETAKGQIESLRKVCTSGGFHLTKFICNRRNVLESIPENERSKDVKALDLHYDDLPIERALGVQWCVESDTFKFRITVKDKPLTRRRILSVVSSIYDPLGFAAPFTLTAKKYYFKISVERKGLAGMMNCLKLTAYAGKSGETKYHCSNIWPFLVVWDQQTSEK